MKVVWKILKYAKELLWKMSQMRHALSLLKIMRTHHALSLRQITRTLHALFLFFFILSSGDLWNTTLGPVFSPISSTGRSNIFFLSDIPLVPTLRTDESRKKHNFTLHWLNNKEMAFSYDAEILMEELAKTSLEVRPSENREYPPDTDESKWLIFWFQLIWWKFFSTTQQFFNV